MPKISQDLHPYNSVFEINGEDIVNLKVEYEFSNYGVVYYKEGKKDKEEVKPCIVFELTGKTKDKKMYGLNLN